MAGLAFGTRIDDGASVGDVGAIATKAVAKKLWRRCVPVLFVLVLFVVLAMSVFSCGRAAATISTLWDCTSGLGSNHFK